MTAEQLLKLPDNGMRRELVLGELREMAPAGDEHGEIAMTIGSHLAQHVKSESLGRTYAAETGFLITRDPDTVRAPDAAFVRQDVIDATGRLRGFRIGAPDLAVEVISPGDTYTEVHEKVMEWLDAGSRMVVVVDPQAQYRHRVPFQERYRNTDRGRYAARSEMWLRVGSCLSESCSLRFACRGR